jgi:hypothetical protein
MRRYQNRVAYEAEFVAQKYESMISIRPAFLHVSTTNAHRYRVPQVVLSPPFPKRRPTVFAPPPSASINANR